MRFIAPAEILNIGTEQVILREYDSTYFLEAEFTAQNIMMPDSIKRSVAKRQAEFLAGRIVARDALCAIQHDACQIPIGEHRAPVWPEGVIGAISHTGKAAIALAKWQQKNVQVGLDMEVIIPEEQCEQLQSMLLNDAECTLLKQQELPWSTLFTLVFSAKESLFKAIYPEVRQYLEFLDSEIVAFNSETQTLSLRMIRRLNSVTFRPRYDVQFRILDNNVVTLLI
ncbi:4'-phosphopantetheinyl transferase superfamily protein [Photobacterium sp. CCB-ST2H9]|uniref:4'-phosphopantetheinyl transferase family protein n=1 Tax=Photobacterium sp. CCB-ST2H9 TaxID=2912855 RepID=UPI002003E858|nr:4'-phosphopantetheinyl transferase superfamily protein [Photobacterium sp. CCB-ST2H9]UTM60135.1 4'-phosphopantetheinyl transferase superfamily protein [Photobacterium sp. CCB-ST2H9]